MTDLNSVTEIGRLVKDADAKTFESGNGVLNFTIAVNRSVKKGDNWEDCVSYFDCKYYTKSAEKLKQYFVKGKQVGVQGHLEQERWEKDGQKQSRIVITCDNTQLLGGNKEQSSSTTSNDSGFPEDIPY